jgi:DNA polymerase-3 subunit delta'
MLTGAKGLGKIELAKAMAHMALCENLTESGVCNECSACHLFKVGNHPDLSLIAAEKAVIKVDQIRKLSRDVTLSSTRNQHKVIIIENAEQMNKASANALLKTLEEPPKKVIIILTTSEIGRLLPTIKSRCIKISLSEPAHDLSIQWLKNYVQSDTSDIQLSLYLTSGSPLLAKNILENNALKVIKLMIQDLMSLLSNEKSILDVSKDWISNESYQYLSYIASLLLVILKKDMRFLQTSEDVQLKSYLSFMDTNNKEEIIIDYVRSIYQFIYRNQTALKTELLLEELLIKWRNYF